MTFYEVLAQVLELLQREGRVSYRALKLQFHLDDDYLEGLTEELIEAKRVAIDEGGRVLAWVGPLAPVFDWFTEGFDTTDLREAKALIEALT